MKYFSSFNLNFSRDMADVVARKGTEGEEVIAASALHPADQLTHVRGEVVLGRASGV